jgi:hypothetical protein
LLSGAALAQTLLLTPPRTSGLKNQVFTFDLIADGGIGAAVTWGTDITLENNTVVVNGQTVPVLQFVPNYGGTNRPFLPMQPFFDRDFSDQSHFANGVLHLEYANFGPPDAVLGINGQVVLGEFQVKMLNTPGPCGTDPNVPCNAAQIDLSALGFPPNGSAVQDVDGNNLLTAVGSAIITTRPPSPEPAGWLTLAGGTGLGLLWLRRRRARS